MPMMWVENQSPSVGDEDDEEEKQMPSPEIILDPPQLSQSPEMSSSWNLPVPIQWPAQQMVFVTEQNTIKRAGTFQQAWPNISVSIWNQSSWWDSSNDGHHQLESMARELANEASPLIPEVSSKDPSKVSECRVINYKSMNPSSWDSSPDQPSGEWVKLNLHINDEIPEESQDQWQVIDLDELYDESLN